MRRLRSAYGVRRLRSAYGVRRLRSAYGVRRLRSAYGVRRSGRAFRGRRYRRTPPVTKTPYAARCERTLSHQPVFLCTSTLFPITAPRMPPAAAPIRPPFTLSRAVVAPKIAPAAAPMAASRPVFFSIVVGERAPGSSRHSPTSSSRSNRSTDATSSCAPVRRRLARRPPACARAAHTGSARRSRAPQSATRTAADCSPAPARRARGRSSAPHPSPETYYARSLQRASPSLREHDAVQVAHRDLPRGWTYRANALIGRGRSATKPS